MRVRVFSNCFRRAIGLRLLLLAMVLGGVVVPSSPVDAAQSTTGGWAFSVNGSSVLLDQCLANPSMCSGAVTWYSNATRSVTLSSGLTVNISVAGAGMLLSATDQMMSARGGANGQFVSNGIVTSTGVQLATTDTGCTYGTLCTNRGTVTVSFSQPVTNPVVSVTGLGGGASNGLTSGSKTVTWTELTLTTPSVTAEKLAGGNLTVAANRIEPTTKNPSFNCSTGSLPDTYGGTVRAACGSIRLNGTGTTFSFTADLGSLCNAACYTGPSDIEDGWTMVVSVDEDFGLAPTSYDTSPTSHVVGSLYMGAAVAADQTGTMNPSTNVDAVAAGANITTIDDGTTALSGTVNLTPSSTFSAPVSLVGVTAAATLCGWIDFDANGTFDNATERACASPASGDTAATLTWNVPAAVSASTKYARLRLSFDANANDPVGKLSSGEIEDYSFSVNVVDASTTSTSSSTSTSSTTVAPATTVAAATTVAPATTVVSTTTVISTTTVAAVTTTTTPVVSTPVKINRTSLGKDAKKDTADALPATGDSPTSLVLFAGLLVLAGSTVLLRRRFQ